jgi:hypothetical protein
MNDGPHGTTDSGKPDWWADNERLRDDLELPPYEPPRFADDTYVHEVVERLEADHACTIRLLGVDTRYPDDWEVYVDGESVARVGRHRDQNGNTVYEVTPEEFHSLVADALPE